MSRLVYLFFHFCNRISRCNAIVPEKNTVQLLFERNVEKSGVLEIHDRLFNVIGVIEDSAECVQLDTKRNSVFVKFVSECHTDRVIRLFAPEITLNAQNGTIIRVEV